MLADQGQVIKRRHDAENGRATLESKTLNFKPIKISEAADLRIHSKVVWR